jgi:quinol monooxygenase YgiN
MDIVTFCNVNSLFYIYLRNSSRIVFRGGMTMEKLAIWAYLEAKPGKEKELEEFLKSALPLAEREPGTVAWYAVKIGPSQFGIWDTFADETGRNAHLNGEIAKALFAKAKDLLAKDPQIHKPEILAAKASGGAKGATGT